MDRSNDPFFVTEPSWLLDVDAQAVCRAVEAEGAHIYFVGGCVRDAILGLDDSDTDLATDAVPEDVMRLANAAGLKAVPTGIDHGTVTVVSGGKGFEVTTFRQDVKTDGRHAEVSFATDIAVDARRRDFTLNALYATPKGELIDPLGGLPDCLARRIRFIEDAHKRIQEDYLRILRFFRFHAWYADISDGFDAETLDAISTHSHSLETLSAERIGGEMIKLLSAPDPAPALAAMRQTGCLMQVLPAADDQWIAPLVHLEQDTGCAVDPIARLAALGGDAPQDRFRLSRAEARHLEHIKEAAYGPMSVAEIAYRRSEGVAHGALLIRHAMAASPVSVTDLDHIRRAAEATFPLTARDLMPTFQGKALGDKIAELQDRWIASDFTMSAQDLLSDL